MKPPATIRTYDLTPTLSCDLARPADAARAWDEAHAVATLQGLVNRAAPRLFVRFVSWAGRNVDDWWLNHLTRPSQWLADADVRPLKTLEELVTNYRADIAGAVIYDPRLPALSNVASSLAGVENLVAIRYDAAPGSVYDRLVNHGPRLSVKRRLNRDDFTGHGPSAKCAAYDWARRELLETGRCDPRYLGYYIDAFWPTCAAAGPANHHTLTNHDYFVARRAMFCDLHCWDDETPLDDPAQPLGTDRATLQRVLRAAHDRAAGEIIHIGGFTPWAYKYTSHGNAGGKHGGVDTEWELVRLVSAYNAFIDADALGLGAMANASFFMHFPLAERYPQAERRDIAAEVARIAHPDADYVMFYVGDWDSAAWLYQRVPDLWEDPRRGEVPLSWAISPALQRRAPMALAHLWQTRAPSDAFIAADNGAGYLNPSMLSEPRPVSGLPAGVSAWARHCQAHYRRWDLSITGFIIDGHAPQMTRDVLDAYATFSPDGIVPQKTDAEALLYGNMPVLRAGPDITETDPAAAGATLAKHVNKRRSKGLRFHWFRTILKSPGWHADAVRCLKERAPGAQVLAAPVFFELLRRELRRRQG